MPIGSGEPRAPTRSRKRSQRPKKGLAGALWNEAGRCRRCQAGLAGASRTPGNRPPRNFWGSVSGWAKPAQGLAGAGAVGRAVLRDGVGLVCRNRCTSGHAARGVARSALGVAIQATPRRAGCAETDTPNDAPSPPKTSPETPPPGVSKPSHFDPLGVYRNRHTKRRTFTSGNSPKNAPAGCVEIVAPRAPLGCVEIDTPNDAPAPPKTAPETPPLGVSKPSHLGHLWGVSKSTHPTTRHGTT